MSDEEIKKELEQHIRIANYVDSIFCYSVSVDLLQKTIDLINRQQAEIKQAKTEARKEFAAELISALKIGEFSWFEEESEMLVEAINELAEGGR